MTYEENIDTAATLNDKGANAGAGGGTQQPEAARKYGDYLIESGIPMPEFAARGNQRSKYPFGTMAVGDSVVIQGITRSTLDGAIFSWRQRKQVDLVKVPVEGGFRVFRRA